MKPWTLLLLLLAACQPDRDQAAGPTTRESPAESPQNAERLPNPMAGDENRGPKTVVVYYRHPTLEGILPREKAIFWLANVADQVKQVIDHLTLPPDDGFGEPIWPVNTYVREVFLLEDGTVVIDFDGAFLKKLSAGATEEELLVMSLVNSILENFEPYDKVRILVEGEVRETFLGHIDIEFPLHRRYNQYTILPEIREEDRIQSEDLDSPEDTPAPQKDRELGT